MKLIIYFITLILISPFSQGHLIFFDFQIKNLLFFLFVNILLMFVKSKFHRSFGYIGHFPNAFSMVILTSSGVGKGEGYI